MPIFCSRIFTLHLLVSPPTLTGLRCSFDPLFFSSAHLYGPIAWRFEPLHFYSPLLKKNFLSGFFLRDFGMLPFRHLSLTFFLQLPAFVPFPFSCRIFKSTV